MTKPTANQVAEFFGVPVANVKRQYAANAEQLRAVAKQAGQRKFRGKTSAEWSKFAQMAQDKSK